MNRLHTILRAVPISVMALTWIGFSIAFHAGGIVRVGAWLVGLQLILPLFGLLSLGWVAITWAFRRRFDRLERAGVFAGITGVAMVAFTLQAVPMAYPAEGTPEVLIRPPMDVPIKVGWGGDTLATNYHAAHPDQRWAYDLMVLPFMVGTENNADYGCFGQPVLAPAAGTIVIARGDQPDRTPGVMVPDDPCGNEVAIELETGTYLVLCHLQQGSVGVAEGDIVTENQHLGRCGNSGHTSEPHLHIHHQRQDPRVYPFGFAEGLRLGFHSIDGSSHPMGGVEEDGDDVRAVGDVIQYRG